MPLKWCSGCKKKPGTKVCSCCHTAVYCDASCQRSHWNKEHKRECCAREKQNIHWASFHGDVAVLKQIMAEFPSLTMDWAAPGHGGTAACVAAQEGKHECLKLLAERGADLTKKNNHDHAPIHAACRHGRIDCLRVLLLLGISPLTPTSDDESIAETPAKMCITFGHLECLELLFSSGVDPNNLNRHGQSHLHLAALCSSDKVILLASSRGGNINLQDDRRHTPLDIAIAMAAAKPTPASRTCVALLRSLGGVVTPRPAGTKTFIMSAFGDVLSSQRATLVRYSCY